MRKPLANINKNGIFYENENCFLHCVCGVQKKSLKYSLLSCKHSKIFSSLKTRSFSCHFFPFL